ncbi:MAG: hypothetical protein FJ279_02165 [Planctomycetes bacterium]|nr:hypothetical protein [Planctomycetota bacterium]
MMESVITIPGGGPATEPPEDPADFDDVRCPLCGTADIEVTDYDEDRVGLDCLNAACPLVGAVVPRGYDVYAYRRDVRALWKLHGAKPISPPRK